MYKWYVGREIVPFSVWVKLIPFPCSTPGGSVCTGKLGYNATCQFDSDCLSGQCITSYSKSSTW